MSTELDGSKPTTRKREKHRKDKDTDPRSKKRKRSEHHDLSLSSPKKKHRSKHPTQDSATTTDIPDSLDSARVSPFFQQTTSLYLALSPICQRYPLQGLCAEHLSPLLLTYYPPLNGVVLSYTNVKLSERLPTHDEGKEEVREEVPVLAQSIDEYAVSYVWVTAEFLLFRPQWGCEIEGWINLQNEETIGLLCWNYFNASIERKRLPEDWKWVPGGANSSRSQKLKGPLLDSDPETEGELKEEDYVHVNGVGDEEGHFIDGKGRKVEGLFRFRVKDMETSRSADREQGFLNIHGTTLREEEEQQLREQEFLVVERKGPQGAAARRGATHVMSGALLNGEADGSAGVDKSPNRKHRMSY